MQLDAPSNPSLNLRPYLSVEEAADVLRTTKRAVYMLIERGHLASAVRRVGRRILLSKKDLLASIEQGSKR